MKVRVETRSGRSLGSFDLAEGATLQVLQSSFQIAHPKYHIDRQRFYSSSSSTSVTDDTSSSTTTTTTPSSPSPPSSKKKRPPACKSDDILIDGSTIIFKDLGPQILWKTVFLIEYLGPLLVFPLFYLQPSILYGSSIAKAATLDISEENMKFSQIVQFSALIAWSFHYLKREFETLFIHRFSHATMPMMNLFKNCIYYWGFAAYVAYFINHPLYTPPSEDLFYTGMCLFYFMEIGNLSAHWTLRTLRPPGTKVRRIPHGGLFEFVSCPNYTYEILAWFGFNLMTRTVGGILFMFAGAFQMFIWAKVKHRRYLREFDGKDGHSLYPPNRKCIIPFVY